MNLNLLITKNSMPNNLIVGFVLDYSHLELGYSIVVMLLDKSRNAFYRGRGNSQEEATEDAINKWKEDVE